MELESVEQLIVHQQNLTAQSVNEVIHARQITHVHQVEALQQLLLAQRPVTTQILIIALPTFSVLSKRTKLHTWRLNITVLVEMFFHQARVAIVHVKLTQIAFNV